jgi:hypothetical protein
LLFQARYSTNRPRAYRQNNRNIRPYPAKRRSKLWNAVTIESEPRYFTIFQQWHFGSLRKLRVQSGNNRTSQSENSTIRKGGRQQLSGRPANDNRSGGRCGLQACSQVRRLAHGRDAPVPFRSRPDRRLRRVRSQARSAKKRFGGGGELRHHLRESKPGPHLLDEGKGRQPTFPFSEGVTRRTSCPRRRYCPGPNHQPGC